MKRLTAILLTLMLLPSVPVLYPAYAEGITTTTANSDDEESGYVDDDEEEATDEPSASEAPTETAVPEDYTGTDNPEENDEEMTMSGGTSADSAPGASGGLGFEGSRFPDCRGHWAEEIIIECTDNNYLDGYDDGSFRPDNPVTPAEFAKIYSAWRGDFYQITDGFWATPYIREMIDDGIFEQGEYSSYDMPMTRAQVAKAVISSLKSEFFPTELEAYKALISDIADAGEYSDSVIKAYMSGIITGYDDGTIRPNDFVTRAELLTILNRAVNAGERTVPEAVTELINSSGTDTVYYSAAVAVRKSSNTSSMNYRLLGANSVYMTEDDYSSGLKMSEEIQGPQGFAFLMRYDISGLEPDNIESIELTMTHASGGETPLALYFYEYKLSDTDWNNAAYTTVLNGSMVAGDDKAGYNSVTDNITAILPTWGDIESAVPAEQKTTPYRTADFEDGRCAFELDYADLAAHADENGMVELFVTTENYDRYGTDTDIKPKCYVAGSNAPHLSVKTSGDSDEKIVTVTADKAQLSGGMLNVFGTGTDAYIENFRSNQTIDYTFDASDGKYNMTIYYAANLNSGGGTVHFNINGSEFDHEFAQTGSWTTYVYEDLGEVELKSGENKMILTDKEIPNTYLINIKTITFEKVD